VIERGLDCREQVVASADEEKTVAREADSGVAQHFQRGAAHCQQTSDIGAELVGRCTFEVEFDEECERGLIAEIGGDGLGEHAAGLRFCPDGDEAIGDGREVCGAEVGLFEKMAQIEVSFLVLSETVGGDGLEPVDDGVVFLEPLGVGATEFADEIEGGAVFSSDDVGFGHDEPGGIGFEVTLLHVPVDAEGEGGVTMLGAEVREEVEGVAIIGEVADDRIDAVLELLGVVVELVILEQVDAGGGAVGIYQFAHECVLFDFGVLAEFAVEGDELGVEFLVAGKLAGVALESIECAIAMAAFPLDTGEEYAAVFGVKQFVVLDECLGGIVVPAVEVGSGGGNGDELVAAVDVRTGGEQLGGDAADFVVLLVLKEKTEEGFEIVVVVLGVGQPFDESALCQFDAVNESEKLGEEEAAFGVLRGGSYADAQMVDGLGPFLRGNLLLGLLDVEVATGGAVLRPTVWKADVADAHVGEAAVVF
jgi:hypothetical protein